MCRYIPAISLHQWTLVSYRFSALVLIDLVLIIPAVLIGIASSGVISGGLATTCDAYREYWDNDDRP